MQIGHLESQPYKKIVGTACCVRKKKRRKEKSLLLLTHI